MRDLFTLLAVACILASACKKADTAKPDDPKEEAAAPRELSENEILAMLEQSKECWEGGPPEGYTINVHQNEDGSLGDITIKPPADEATTACVVAKVKARFSERR